jgi:hypothetical protein
MCKYADVQISKCLFDCFKLTLLLSVNFKMCEYAHYAKLELINITLFAHLKSAHSILPYNYFIKFI